MKHMIPILAWLALAPSAFGQNAEKLSVEVLIERLGSANFAVRDQATKALRLRPESEPALRKAIPLANTEVRRRIESLLDYFERGPLRELDEHVQAGRMDDFIKLVAVWPEGKFEDEVWGITMNFLEKVYDLHLKKGGTKPLNYPVSAQLRQMRLPVVKADRVTEATKGTLEKMYFIRARDINIGFDGPFNNEFEKYSLSVVANTVDFPSNVPSVIIAGKRININDVSDAIIICGGDVMLGGSTNRCLIIACGSVVQLFPETGASCNHIIAGAKVKLIAHFEGNLIVENEPNPLGYIRWLDTQKAKAAGTKPGAKR